MTEPVTGAALLDLVAVMDRLRSPGGCPWDAEQTHSSLLQYLIEECYETIEAVESGDRAHLQEELGDLLLQIVFHARIAAEHPDAPFDIDDVAAGIADKLRRRHPHVFAGVTVSGTAEVEANWEALKAAEKGRASAMDGVPTAQPALALAAKLQRRARSAGVGPTVPVTDLPADADLGQALFSLVATAVARGLDPEAELRRAAREFAAAVRADEQRRDS
jgi:XTP/dITP diphosphohydrolase